VTSAVEQKGANVDDDHAIHWYRRLYDRLRGSGGLTLGLIIGAVAFGASTAGAGPSGLQDPGGLRRGIAEECREGCDQEEANEHLWGDGLTEYILDQVFEAPPTTTPRRLAAP